jgi:hypothetical protein
VVLLSAVLLAGGLAALLGNPGFETRLVAERGLGDEARWLWVMLATVGGAGLLAAGLGRIRGALRACALTLALLWAGYGFVVHPLLDDENSARGLMLRARELAGADVEIGLVDWKEQNLLQARGPVAEFGFRQPPAEQFTRGLDWLRAEPARRELLVQRTDALACVTFEETGATRRVGVANRREWWLLDADAVSGCP